MSTIGLLRLILVILTTVGIGLLIALESYLERGVVFYMTLIAFTTLLTQYYPVWSGDNEYENKKD